MKILTMKELILLNQYVQGVVKRLEIVNWFSSLPEDDKRSVVKSVWLLAVQAQIVEDDIPTVTLEAGLKPTHTPVVMLSKGNESLHKRGYGLSRLSGVVLNQAFLLVLESFALAERRRKEKEGSEECNHWWHKNLADENIIKEILEKN
ncbi:MAG TPA: DUF5958 family protein [Anaerovoracaceae bacterium]|nr:DUF5958 family protein [Anaerovoracaceae bacterium]